MNRSLAFVLHDLNPWGGHDRSTLEIARRLSHVWPVEIHAYSFQDPQGSSAWGNHRFSRVFLDPRRPAALRILWFYLATLPGLRFWPKLLGREAPLVHATGSCSFVSDVVQVQFVHAAWKATQKRLGWEESGPRSSKLSWIYHRLLLRHNEWMERQVYSGEKTFIAISHSVARELGDLFGIQDRIHVIHHGVDSNEFRPADGVAELEERRSRIRKEIGLREGEKAALFVGAYERKGLGVAIEAMARLSPQARSKIRLVAVGGGNHEKFLAHARRQGVEDRVVLLGHRKNIAEVYQASDLFVLPTLYEPFGLVILEALASGLPSIVSRLAGASELIRDGESGILIQDPTQPDEVARALERLARDEDLCLSMGKKARELAVARSWDQVAREYAEVLAPLMSRNWSDVCEGPSLTEFRRAG